MDLMFPKEFLKNAIETLVSQKNVKCANFTKNPNLPYCYIENSAKEDLVLEHVKDYERQFRLVYREHSKRTLLLYPKNECSVEKFICTTVRPTQLPFLELYEWTQSAEFVANFLQYEELNPPDRYPNHIPSPTNILAWQYGDCFDFAMVLCSILIGAGYDAYCVHGHAPKEITTRDQTRTRCPLEILESEMPDTAELAEQNEEEEFEIPVKPPPISEFLSKKKQKEEEAERLRLQIENTIDDDAPEILPPDVWKGKRLHCWILIKEGKRGVEESFFVEPTTGRSFSLADSKYENVEFVWNDQNFWINMFPNRGVEEVSFDLYNGVDWEYVMLETGNVKEKGKKEEHFDEEGEEGAVDDGNMNPDEIGTDGYVKQIEHVLDLPPPWSPKMRIDREVYARKWTLGEKTLFYEKCKVDYYADYSQFDGLVRRLTYYHDYKRHIVKEIRWIYARRIDKLAIRRRFPLEYKTVEEYYPGCPYHWKQIVEIDGKSKLTIYYPTRNTDGLIRREEVYDEKTREYFQDRDDFMIYRSWKIEKRESTARDYTLGDKVVITSMTQKFDKNPNLPKGTRIEKIIYDMKKKFVTVFYHYEPGSIKRNVIKYPRDDFTALAKVQDGQEHEEVDEVYQDKLHQLQDMEKACYAGIKSQENALKQEMEKYKEQEDEWSKLRRRNDVNIALVKGFINKTIYDKAREKSKEQEREREEEKVTEVTAIDYLTPVLKEMGLENRQLNAQEAQEVENRVMSLLKERLLHRADIIKKSLERERKALNDDAAKFAKKGDHVTAEEQKKYDESTRDMDFKINILEQRVARHEEQALQKYAEMSLKLKNEPILAALHQYHKRD